MRLEFSPDALDQLNWWVKKDRKIALRILGLIKEIQRTPFEGTGKPEPLKHNLSGYWSRRIDQTNRLVYKAEKDIIIIISCRYHY